MLRSLRARLVLLVLGVVATALLSVALLARVAMHRASIRFLSAAHGASLAGIAPLLADVPEAELDARLARAAEPLGLRLLLLGVDGGVRAASSPELHQARVTLSGERLEVEERQSREGRVVARRTILLGAERVALPGGGGLLFALPVAERETAPSPMAGLDRSLVLAALLAGSLALGLAWLMGRRIVRPLEGLTEAARRMGVGDLEVRVPVRGEGELADLAAAFNAMADARARAERLRRALVSDVAHELRTPLTNLRAHLEAIEDGLQAPDESAIRSLHEEALLLARLVDDLQDLALAEAGGLSLRRERLALAEQVEGALAGLAPQAAARGVALRATVPAGAEAWADRERLGQVLRNLLANAVAHTGSGGEVVVSAEEAAPGVRLTVTDTGEGIAPEHLPHVFERFYRADPSRARASGGAGLGLAIVAQLVQAHGGTVSVDSEPGRGTRFTVTLPSS